MKGTRVSVARFALSSTLSFVLSCAVAGCGLDEALKKETKNDTKNDTKSETGGDSLDGARGELVLHWKFAQADTQGYVLKKIVAGSKEAVEIARVGKSDAALVSAGGDVTYAVSGVVSKALAPGDCLVVSALLASDAETAPSPRACLPQKQ